MAYKVLGQANPTLNTDTDLYTCPANMSFVCSSLWVCNQVSTSALVRVAIRPNGAGIAAQHYVLFDVPLDGLWAGVLIAGITGDASDVITVRANSSTVSFNAFGDER